MPITNRVKSFWPAVAGAILVMYLGLAIATMLTREPWCDEAWFNSPALNLATRGYMGTAYLDPASNIGKPRVRLDGIDRYTYWMTPLYPVVQAAWFKVAGFGILRARTMSVVWGLVALLAWWAIAERLSDRLAASVAALLVGVEYNFIHAATDARMDAMCAALGAGGLAMYLRQRVRGFGRAILLANAAIAAALLTHPMAAVYGLALVVMVFFQDRSRLRWSHLPLCAAPYAVGLAAWGVYISKAPDLFALQFAGNATGRGPGVLQPWAALHLELWHRYGESFGMAVWTSGPARAKIFIALLYLGGLAWVHASRELRSREGIRLVWITANSVLLFLWLFEGTKTPLYLVHVLPWLCLLAAIALCDIARHGPIFGWGAAAAVAVGVGIQVLSTAMPALRNPYRNQYTPAMAFLSRHLQPSDTIMGDSAAGFALGSARSIVDDAWLGYQTGKKLDWLVVTPVYAGTIEALSEARPEIYRYVIGLLDQYQLVFSGRTYRIYVRKNSVAAGREF